METKAEVFLPLSQGKVAVIDFDDFEKVRGTKWFAHKQRHTYYARRNTSRKLGKRQMLFLHHEIVKPGPGLEVDHKDGDGLNCRRDNLRVATRAQNQHNQRARKGTSNFKGVSWFKPRGKWRAQIRISGRVLSIGCFPSEEEAARAYDAAATKYFGEFALLNFPDQKQCQSLINSGGAA